MFTIVVAIVFFAVIVTVAVLLARLAGAGNATVLHVIIAMLIAGVANAALAVVVQEPLIYLLIANAVAVFVYAWILRCGFLGGILVHIGSGVAAAGMSAMLIYSLGWENLQQRLALPWQQNMVPEAGLNDVARSAEAVCRCGVEQECLLSRAVEFSNLGTAIDMDALTADERRQLQSYVEKVDDCVSQPAAFAADEPADDTLFEPDVVVAQVNNPQPAPSQAPPPPAASQYSYRAVSPGRLAGYVDRRIRIHRSGGKQHQGRLTSVSDNHLVLEVRRHSGVASLQVPLNSVQQVEVHGLWQ